MTKSFKCADVDTQCGWSATANNDEELKLIKEHAEHCHGKTNIPVDKKMQSKKRNFHKDLEKTS